MDHDILDMLRGSAESFLEAHRHRLREKGIRNLPLEVDRAVWTEMAGLGWLGVSVPEALGGAGLGLEGAAELTMLFGKSAFPEPFIAACVMPAALIADALGNQGAGELAHDMLEGGRILSVAWQEQAGQLVAGRPLTRMANGRVSGTKVFVPAVEPDGVLLVQVDSAEKGVGIVAVPVADERVRYETQACGVGTFSTVYFNEAPVLDTPLLIGDEAQRAVQRALDSARIALSAQLTGVAMGALEVTLRHVSDRIQFERKIGSFQAIQHRCVDLLLGVRLADASWRHALRTLAEQGMGAASAAAISAAKARAGDVALEVTRAAVQMHGAMGFTDEAQPGFYLRAAMHGSAWLGTPLMHRRHFRQTHAGEALHV